jgi:DNA-binding NarL/FixJ family response regulator
MGNLRVLIAEDHDEMRTYLAVLLSVDYQVVGAVSNGEELVRAASFLLPDVIVSDIVMPRIDGLAARNELISRGILIPFVFVSLQGKEIIQILPKSGALAVVYKCEISRHLFKAVGAVIKGETYFSPFYLK